MIQFVQLQVVQEYLEKYSDLKNLNPLEIINDEILKQQFFNVYLEEIYEKVKPKKDVISVLKELEIEVINYMLLLQEEMIMHLV